MYLVYTPQQPQESDLKMVIAVPDDFPATLAPVLVPDCAQPARMRMPAASRAVNSIVRFIVLVPLSFGSLLYVPSHLKDRVATFGMPVIMTMNASVLAEPISNVRVPEA